MSFGVTPQGFNRARLPELLAEIEETARGVFGAGVVQTAQSPLGQLNGLFADLAATLWEAAEDTYQSFDVDQAEGKRLEQLGRLRLLGRLTDETDPVYRSAITNADRARLDVADIERAAASTPGVTWAKAYAAGRCSTVQGLPPRSVAVAVLGGSDSDIAASIHPYVVPGIDLYGNTAVDLIVDGYCRPYALVRPVMRQLALDLTVKLLPDRQGCPAPSSLAISETIAAAFSGAARPVNGQDVTLHLLRTILAATYPNVEIVSGTAALLPGGASVPLPYSILFFEMAAIAPNDVNVTVV